MSKPDMTRFPALVEVIHEALEDLLGEQFDLDKPALAVELADSAWRWLCKEWF